MLYKEEELFSCTSKAGNCAREKTTQEKGLFVVGGAGCAGSLRSGLCNKEKSQHPQKTHQRRMKMGSMNILAQLKISWHWYCL